jgi:hypothetical protein
MKKIALLLLLSIGLFSACEGPSGPPGPSGPSGTNIVGKTYEYNISFSPSNNYQLSVDLPQVALKSDVVLAYMLFDTFDGENVWRQLPQTYMLPEGLLVYNYDFTRFDVKFYMDTNFDPILLNDTWKVNHKLRVVVVPADFANKLSKNPSYNEVTTALKIQSKDFKKVTP